MFNAKPKEVTTIDNDTHNEVVASNATALASSIMPDDKVTSSFRVDVSKGSVDSAASRQWATRPDEDKYLDLLTMRNAVKHRYEVSKTVELPANAIEFDESMKLKVGEYGNLDLTNWTYNQLCVLADAPNSYIKKLPNELASKCLSHGLDSNASGNIKALINSETNELRAINSATYGRIWDYQVLDEIIKIAGNGVNDTNWKVPGMLDWSSSNGVTVEYNPYVDVTKETTTLYASDRDVFVFLVDDTRPIEIGKLPNGEPDLVFRGFYVSNSETGAGTFDMACMMMRGVCANRNIWGVEGKQTLQLRHSLKGPEKFAKQAFPMLAAYSMAPTLGIVSKVKNAKALIIANDDEERLDYLTGSKVGLGKETALKVIQRVFTEEEHPMTSLWDVVQGITAHARTIKHQNTRVELETKAGKLMSKVSA